MAAAQSILAAFSAILPAAKRANDAGPRIVDRGQHLVLANEQTRARSGHEHRRRIATGVRAARTNLGLPRPPTSVEDGGVEAEGTQHPPEPGRPHVLARVVEDDAEAVTDAEPPHPRCEPVRAGQGERPGGPVRVGKPAQVGERRARNVSPLPASSAAPDPRQRLQAHLNRRVDDPQVWISQVFREPTGFDERREPPVSSPFEPRGCAETFRVLSSLTPIPADSETS